MQWFDLVVGRDQFVKGVGVDFYGVCWSSWEGEPVVVSYVGFCLWLASIVGGRFSCVNRPMVQHGLSALVSWVVAQAVQAEGGVLLRL